MAIDFGPMHRGEKLALELAENVSVEDLRQATNESIDYLLSVVRDLTDADIAFDPIDTHANDPDAKPGEEHIGWTIGHLIVHATASSEEAACVASILARGIEVEGRLRYETPWETVTTVAQCVQRLEESRRMRLGYLDAFPDEPQLEVYRKISERFTERFGKLNATAQFLFGLSHEVGHYEQLEEVKKQALSARQQ